MNPEAELTRRPERHEKQRNEETHSKFLDDLDFPGVQITRDGNQKDDILKRPTERQENQQKDSTLPQVEVKDANAKNAQEQRSEKERPGDVLRQMGSAKFGEANLDKFERKPGDQAKEKSREETSKRDSGENGKGKASTKTAKNAGANPPNAHDTSDGQGRSSDAANRFGESSERLKAREVARGPEHQDKHLRQLEATRRDANDRTSPSTSARLFDQMEKLSENPARLAKQIIQGSANLAGQMSENSSADVKRRVINDRVYAMQSEHHAMPGSALRGLLRESMSANPEVGHTSASWFNGRRPDLSRGSRRATG